MSISSYYTTTRLTGMYSGLDTESLVTSAMSTEQSKLDKLYQEQQIQEWKNEAYTELNDAVSALRNSYLSVLGENSLIKNAAYHSFTVNMAENAAVKITGTSSALPTDFTILSTARATAASVSSQLDTSQTELVGSALMRARAEGTLCQSITGETTIGDLAERFGLGEGENLSFSINGETFAFSQDTTLAELAEAVNGNEDAAATMTIDEESGAITLQSDVLGADSALTLSNITGTAFGEDAGFGISEGSVKSTSVLSADALSATTLAQLAADTGREFADGTITVNGVEIAVSGEDTIADVIDRVNESGAGVELRFDEGTGKFTLRNQTDGSANTAENAAIEVSGVLFGENGLLGMAEGSHAGNGSLLRSDSLAEAARKLGAEVGDTLSFTVNGVEFSFDTETDTIMDVMNAVNNSSAGAVFSYSELTDSFEIRAEDTGSGSTLSISGMEALFGLSNENVTAGTDASITVNSNGVERTIQQSGNTFELDGLSFEITGTEVFENGLSVSVEQDYQPTIDAVKSFVEEYNALIEKLNTYYYAEKYRDYAPLTDEQRAELTEDEAAKWDEKAMSGILRNDSAIGNLLTSLRSSLSAVVSDTGMNAFSIGLSTVAWSSDSWRTEQGKLTLDEDKLLAALKEDANAVQKVLTNISDDSSASAAGIGGTSESGLLMRMNGFLSSFNSTMRSQNIQNTTKSIASYAEKITDQLTKMAEQEERLWAKYSALETAMAELQSQSDYITSLFGTSS